jgi:hypothetical protein
MTLLTRNSSKGLSESAALVAESGETRSTGLICLGSGATLKFPVSRLTEQLAWDRPHNLINGRAFFPWVVTASRIPPWQR